MFYRPKSRLLQDLRPVTDEQRPAFLELCAELAMNGTFAGKVANPLPLADAALRILDHIAQIDFLSQEFDTYRGSSYDPR